MALGATVTITHTIGVFALGAGDAALSQYILPEDLYPWLNLVSGLLVVGVGAAVLRSHVRRISARHRTSITHHATRMHDHGTATRTRRPSGSRGAGCSRWAPRPA